MYKYFKTKNIFVSYFLHKPSNCKFEMQYFLVFYIVLNLKQ